MHISLRKVTLKSSEFQASSMVSPKYIYSTRDLYTLTQDGFNRFLDYYLVEEICVGCEHGTLIQFTTLRKPLRGN